MHICSFDTVSAISLVSSSSVCREICIFYKQNYLFSLKTQLNQTYILFSCFSRVFQRIATLGLYLFNDALVITRRTSKHFPFSRAVEYTYKFDLSVALTALQVVDIPDSKCKLSLLFHFSKFLFFLNCGYICFLAALCFLFVLFFLDGRVGD